MSPNLGSLHKAVSEITTFLPTELEIVRSLPPPSQMVPWSSDNILSLIEFRHALLDLKSLGSFFSVFRWLQFKLTNQIARTGGKRARQARVRNLKISSFGVLMIGTFETSQRMSKLIENFVSENNMAFFTVIALQLLYLPLISFMFLLFFSFR